MLAPSSFPDSSCPARAPRTGSNRASHIPCTSTMPTSPSGTRAERNLRDAAQMAPGCMVASWEVACQPGGGGSVDVVVVEITVVCVVGTVPVVDGVDPGTDPCQLSGEKPCGHVSPASWSITIRCPSVRL